MPGVVLREWLARTSEEVIDPEQPIIDPHHHLWDRRPRPESPEGSLTQSEIDALPKWIGRLPLCYLADDLMDDVRGGGHTSLVLEKSIISQNIPAPNPPPSAKRREA